MRRIDVMGTTNTRLSQSILQQVRVWVSANLHRVIQGASWTFLATVLSNSAGFVVSLVSARTLGVDGYGAYGLILSTYALFSQFGGLSVAVTATKFVAGLRESNPARAGELAGFTILFSILSYGTAACLLAAFAGPIARDALHHPGLATSLVIVAPLVLVGGFDAVQVAILSGLEDFRASAVVSAIRAPLNIVVTTAGVLTFGLSGAVGALVVLALITTLLNWRAMRRALSRHHIILRYRFTRASLRVVWQFSLPAFLAACTVVPSTWLVNAMLAASSGGLTEVGLLTAALQWRPIAVLVPSVFNATILSVQASLYATPEKRVYTKSLDANLISQGALAFVTCSILGIAAPALMRLYGSEYATASSVLATMAASWFFLAPSWVLWNFFISSEQVWAGLLFNVVGAAALLGLSLYWSADGANGVARAFVTSSAVLVTLQLMYYFHWRRNALR